MDNEREAGEDEVSDREGKVCDEYELCENGGVGIYEKWEEDK